MAYGSPSDSRKFNMTSSSRKLTRGLLDLPALAKLPEDNDGYVIPFVFACDEAFLPREILM